MKRLAKPGLLAMSVLISAAMAGCVSTPKPVETVASICDDITIPIYFQADAAAITPDARRLIAAEARRARACRVDGVEVLGLADAAGEPAANLELSRKRAAAVAEAIAKAGLPAARFSVDAAGQAGATTVSGQVPLRRRADVTLKLSRPS